MPNGRGQASQCQKNTKWGILGMIQHTVPTQHLATPGLTYDLVGCDYVFDCIHWVLRRVSAVAASLATAAVAMAAVDTVSAARRLLLLQWPQQLRGGWSNGGDCNNAVTATMAVTAAME
jgi:hypothetical protein